MTPASPDGTSSARQVFDALPFPAFIVDEDVRLIAVNPAAVRFLGNDPATVLRQRNGEALHCIHASETSQGCGGSPACRECVVRTNVTFAFLDGQPSRTRATLEYMRDGQVREMHALVTASPLVYEDTRRALVIIEDLPTLFAQTDLLPICMTCKKIRDNKLWLQVEAYLDAHLDLKFTHGICPDCAQKIYDRLDGPRA
jgi:PAS domain-containing protein